MSEITFITLIRKDDPFGRDSFYPKYDSELPIFMHITEGCISVTVEAWKFRHAAVAELHGIRIAEETSGE